MRLKSRQSAVLKQNASDYNTIGFNKLAISKH